MRQVGPNELLYNIGYALKRLPASTRKDLASDERRRQDQASAHAARVISDVLGRYEILSPAPLPESQGDDLFRTAQDKGFSGVSPMRDDG